MGKTKIVFSFDTEDFTAPHAADAILLLAKTLREEGVRGCFCLVGLLAKQLVAWGRQDVLDALSYHEINFHTYGHSLHPDICEYTDLADYYTAKRLCIEEETLGTELVRSATGAQKIFAAVPPGNSKSYVAMYSYAEMGIPLYCDTVCDAADGRGIHYCNVFNMDYVQSLEGLFFKADGYDSDALLDRLAKRKKAIIYNHPNYIFYKDWWDIINYDKGNTYPFGEWKEGRRRDAALIEGFFKQLRELLRRIKSDDRFEIVTYGDIVASENICDTSSRTLNRSELPDIYETLKRDFAPLFVKIRGDSFSLSDIFSACVYFLKNPSAGTFKTAPVYGFLDTPYAIPAPLSVSADDVISAARKIDTTTFLPERIFIGGAAVGPADMLFAMLEVLTRDKSDGLAVSLIMRPEMPPTDLLPALAGFSNSGTWRHLASYEDRYLSRRLKLQAWTMREQSRTPE